MFHKLQGAKLIKTLYPTSQRASVLVSSCCSNKLPQTQWLKTTQVYYFTVLEVRSLKCVVKTVILLEAWRENQPSIEATYIP